jgi:signal transduction histidine kinase
MKKPQMHPVIRSATATREILRVPKKTLFIHLRWLIIIICSYLLLLSQQSAQPSPLVALFICLYILSNVGLRLVHERLFESSYFYAPLVLIDTFCITASLMMSQQIGSDFYLAYFLIILLCATVQDFYGSITVAVLLSLVYGYLLLNTAETYDSSSFLRPLFLFVVSLFYGYFAQIVRAETLRREEAEEHHLTAQLRAEMERVKSEFMTNAAHEFRTPLTAVMGYSQLLADGCFGPLTGEQKDAVDKLLETAGTLRNLVQDIDDYAELESRESTLELARDDFGTLLREVQREIAPLEKNRPYRVQYDVEKELPRIETDWKKLKTVLTHLLGNAVKFTDGGAVKLSVRAERSAGELSFTVTDTGIGIPKEQLPLIFEGFRQLDSSTTRRYGGTGIGLAICKGFVEILGGRIEVESEAGKGTTFTVTLRAGVPPENGPYGLAKSVPHQSTS